MRQCSYCRESEHDKRKCPTLHAERAGIHDATVNRRLALLRSMARAGYGTGALVKIENYGEVSTCVIGDLSTVVSSWHFFSYHKVKYTKTVNVRDNQNGTAYEVPVINMTKGGTLETLRFYYNQLLEGDMRNQSYFYRRIGILSSCNDLFIPDDETLQSNIYISSRLICGEDNPHSMNNVVMNNSFTNRAVITDIKDYMRHT